MGRTRPKWREEEDNVTTFYEVNAEKEAGRLFKDAYHRLEYDVTMHYLLKHLPPKGHILDLGCGPGNYSMALARRGYTVTLVDVSQRLLEIAQGGLKDEGLLDRVASVLRADARDLSEFEDAAFDGVLVFGPVYHLVEERDRHRALDEVVRVAKVGSPVFISAIGRYGVYRTLLTRPEFEGEFSREECVWGMRKGINMAKWYDGDEAFPDAWFCTPQELKELAESHGIRTIEMAACEGLSSHHREDTERLSRNPDAWRIWMELVLKTSNDPSIVGSSEHFLYIGRRSD